MMCATLDCQKVFLRLLAESLAKNPMSSAQLLPLLFSQACLLDSSSHLFNRVKYKGNSVKAADLLPASSVVLVKTLTLSELQSLHHETDHIPAVISLVVIKLGQIRQKNALWRL